MPATPPPDSAHFAAFLLKHASESSESFRLLLDAIKDGRVAPHEHTCGVSRAELASTYEVRGKIAEEQGKTETAHEMRRFAALCRRSPNATCDFWMFSGSSESFVVFELFPENLAAWCVRFEGSLTEGKKGAA